jgi:hypothetical protein
MMRAFGISHAEAVARVNRQWSRPGPSGRVPRIWIVGLDLAYHQTPDDWAATSTTARTTTGGTRKHTLGHYHRPC